MQPLKTVVLRGTVPGGSSHSAKAKYLAVDPLANRIAVCWSASADFAAPAWELNTHIYDCVSSHGVAFHGFSTRSPGLKGTELAAFSPSGRMLAAPSPIGSVVHLIDVDSVLDSNRENRPVERLGSVGSGGSLGIAWSPDGNLLAHFCIAAAGPWLEFWRLPNGDDPEHMQAKNLGAVRVPGKIGGFGFPHRREVVFSPNNDLVAVAGLSKPNVLRLYSVTRGEFVAESAPLECDVTKLAFSHDGLHVFSGDSKGSVVAWRLEGIDRPSLVRGANASLGGGIIGLDVDRDTQVLWIASESNKKIDLHTAAPPGSQAGQLTDQG
jgi:WD40 repeat protein